MTPQEIVEKYGYDYALLCANGQLERNTKYLNTVNKNIVNAIKYDDQRAVENNIRLANEIATSITEDIALLNAAFDAMLKALQ